MQSKSTEEKNIVSQPENTHRINDPLQSKKDKNEIHLKKKQSKENN